MGCIFVANKVHYGVEREPLHFCLFALLAAILNPARKKRQPDSVTLPLKQKELLPIFNYSLIISIPMPRAHAQR